MIFIATIFRNNHLNCPIRSPVIIWRSSSAFAVFSLISDHFNVCPTDSTDSFDNNIWKGYNFHDICDIFIARRRIHSSLANCELLVPRSLQSKCFPTTTRHVKRQERLDCPFVNLVTRRAFSETQKVSEWRSICWNHLWNSREPIKTVANSFLWPRSVEKGVRKKKMKMTSSNRIKI